MRRFLAAVTAVLAVVLAGCSTAASSSSASSGGATVTFALPVGTTPNYILPFLNGAISNNIDGFQFLPFLWRPLYWYGINGQPTINYSQSVAGPPVYSNGGRTVTINLNRRFTWPGGRPITNRDVQFWMNLLFAEKAFYWGYIPGGIPDNITSMSFPSSHPYTFSLTFNQAYSQDFILYDQLSQIVPIPQYAWDRTSPTGKIGNYDMTHSGAVAVFNYLNGAAKKQSTYSTNPMWKVVDGPWLLQAFSPSTGATTFVPNPAYTGPGKPKIARFEEIPFTSSTAEFNALRSGQIDYGYLPPEDISQASYFTSRGYTVSRWPDFGLNLFFLNYSNPTDGAIFKQLYFRQAMQSLINQPQIVKDIYHNQAFQTYGPIPLNPTSSFLNAALKTNPYPYSVANAKSLLANHGWSVVPNGVDTCQRPGTGPADCGAGIVKGQALSFTQETATGSVPFLSEVEAMVSSWAKVGIKVSIQERSVNGIFGELVPCSNNNAGCSWQIANVGEPGVTATYSPEYLPTPTQWFTPGASNDPEGYANAKMNQLMAAADLSNSANAVRALALYAAQQLPVLWEPNYPYQTSVISPHLKGALPQDPNLNLYPQYWTFK